MPCLLVLSHSLPYRINFMKNHFRITQFLALVAVGGFVALPSMGCGSSGELTNVTENADAEKIAEFDRLEAEAEAEAEEENEDGE